jgi:hypothetical protein
VVTRLALGVVALVAMLAPATASGATRVTSSTRPLISDNITPVFTVPGVHPIGARIRGNDMFVTGPEGLTVFDITDPEHPIPEGALPLPHFENEDVDLGGNTLLISNDPSEGVGVVYVIDISDPTMPVLASATPNGSSTSASRASAPRATFRRAPATRRAACRGRPASASTRTSPGRRKASRSWI